MPVLQIIFKNCYLINRMKFRLFIWCEYSLAAFSLGSLADDIFLSLALRRQRTKENRTFPKAELMYRPIVVVRTGHLVQRRTRRVGGKIRSSTFFYATCLISVIQCFVSIYELLLSESL